jgi:hypothetical protein
VFFLTGTFGGSAKRGSIADPIEIQKGTPILIPLVNLLAFSEETLPPYAVTDL